MYPATLNLEAFNPAVFSARRLPDRIHYRIVRCNTCGLVRSDPIADPHVLTRLYQQSTFDYADEIANLQLTYGQYLAKAVAYGVQKGALLEIGCGNGFFLEEALKQGFVTVQGVEPSAAAVEQADPRIRPYILRDILRSEMFEPEQFDVICAFQVFDHLHEPDSMLFECFRVLKPGGLLLCLNHNIEALSARFLRDRSPIIDIEHTYLYSPTTLSKIIAAHGFKIVHVGSAFNRYSIYYLARLIPLPTSLKGAMLRLIKSTPVRHIRLSVPLGNLYLIARKPALEEENYR